LRNMSRKLAWIGFFLFVTLLLTVVGWLFSLSQIHSRDWKGEVSILLLLPYAGVNRVFWWASHSEQLSPSMYHLAFVLGSLGQLLYYFAIFALVKYLAKALRHRARSG